MRLRHWRAALAAALLASAAIAAGKPPPFPDTAERARIQERALDALRQGRFGELDAAYQAALRAETRLPSGVWAAGRYVYVLQLSGRRQGESEAEFEARVQAYHEKLRRWRDQSPTSTLAAYALVQHHIRKAFVHRGTALAADVPPEQWEHFHREIRHAMEELGRPELPRDPVWYWAALEASHFASVPTSEYLALLEEGASRHPYFYDLYFAGLPRLQPKWGGSWEALDAVAELAVRQTEARDGRSAYARVYWSHAFQVTEDMLFLQSKATWPKLKKGFEDLLARYPDTWNADAFARLACIARDGSTLKELIERYGDNILFIGFAPQKAARCRALATS